MDSQTTTGPLAELEKEVERRMNEARERMFFADRKNEPISYVIEKNVARALAELRRWLGRRIAKAASVEKPSPVVRSGAWLGALDDASLEECPVGLFVWEGELCFKSEYSTNGRADAYVVASGEYFWGGTDSPEAVGRLRVTPLEGRWAPNDLSSATGAGGNL